MMTMDCWGFLVLQIFAEPGNLAISPVFDIMNLARSNYHLCRPLSHLHPNCDKKDIPSGYD